MNALTVTFIQFIVALWIKVLLLFFNDFKLVYHDFHKGGMWH